VKTINTASVVRDGDRLHELLLKRQAFILQAREAVRTMNDEISGLNKHMMRASNGEDFMFPSSDGFLKIVDISMEEGAFDIEAMEALILKLRRKVPRKPDKPRVIVRHVSTEEMEYIEGND
jgi:hypothetical protein